MPSEQRQHLLIMGNAICHSHHDHGADQEPTVYQTATVAQHRLCLKDSRTKDFSITRARFVFYRALLPLFPVYFLIY